MEHEHGPDERAHQHGRHRDDAAPVLTIPWPPAMVLSAAIPVMVKVSTVVVRSGTASLRAVAFCRPMARARRTIRG